VPFLLRWKGTLPAGKLYDEPVIQLDLLATAVTAGGGKIDPGWKLDGVDLLPYLTGKAAGQPHETLYWRMGPNNWAIRHGDWKIVQTFRSGDPKLFDLKADLGESRDRRAENPAVYADLRKRWEAWNGGLAEPSWVDPNPDPFSKGKKQKQP
jgi:arylsulfatase A-like enzyme